VHAADLFADLDLRVAAAAVVVPQPYPEGLPAAVESFPRCPWLYTGGLENHPRVIETLAATRPLAGCGAAAVARVRDPVMLGDIARRAGLPLPDTRPTPAGLPLDGSWLLKPLASAGGRGIRRWLGDAPSGHDAGASIWQRHVPGTAWAASYLLTPAAPRLIGASRQLVGRRWCHAGGFAWCGAVDVPPESLPSLVLGRLLAFGAALAAAGLVGLVGVDLVVDRRGAAHVLEVNPRPTASMELVERATGLPLVPAHLAACGLAAPVTPPDLPRSGTWSKAVLFAAGDVDIDEQRLAGMAAAAGSAVGPWPLLADVPASPQVIRAGRPICTLFAHGMSPRRSLARLRRRTAAVADLLARVPAGA